MLILLTTLTASALQLGDPAPPISPGGWLQGAPEDPQGKVVVVEFFATWCGPCRETVPHLSALQAAHPDDLIVIGVAADHAESPALLRRFIGATGMTYPAILDDRGRTYADYMTGMDIDAIPAAFLIDRTGRLVWQGHPTLLDEPLAEAVASPVPEPAHHAPVPELQATPEPEEIGLWERLCGWCARLLG